MIDSVRNQATLRATSDDRLVLIAGAVALTPAAAAALLVALRSSACQAGVEPAEQPSAEAGSLAA